jgi:hypothetical protein
MFPVSTVSGSNGEIGASCVPIELSWLIPDKILLSRWTDDITVEDMCVLVEELRIVLDAAAFPIHTVIDLSEVRHISTETAYVYLQSQIPTHPHRGRIGMVKPNSEGEIAANLVNCLSQREMVRMFSTRVEARDYLLSHDAPPPPLPSDCDPPLSSSGSPFLNR